MKWGCSRRTSLRDVELVQGELASALDSVELQQMVGWLATQYQRLAAKAEKDGQFSAAVGALNALRAMVVQPQLDAQLLLTLEAVSRTKRTAGNYRAKVRW